MLEASKKLIGVPCEPPIFADRTNEKERHQDAKKQPSAPAPAPTPEEIIKTVLRRHLSAKTNVYHDAIAAEIVAELPITGKLFIGIKTLAEAAKERP